MAHVYSFDEVSKHSTKKDLWVVIHNNVYDVTEFVQDHPGGEEVLLDEAGRNATESFEDIGHSEEARMTLANFQIGVLDPASRREYRRFTAIRANELPKAKGSGGTWKVFLPALIIAGALAYKFVLEQKH
ncbi:cytochrome b5 [Dichotomocladium elegans]|nr:cytochrome b5 [Dichotomocladium elegans]